MRVEILGQERRRRWGDEKKLGIVMSVGLDGATVTEVAHLHDVTRQQIYAWRHELKKKGLLPPMWEYIWTPEEVGRYILRCRAIDGAGCVQPDLQRSDCESYAANWIVPVEVTVVPQPQTYEEEFVI